jgi:hypothetical protein
MNEERISELREMLKADQSSPDQRFPDQAVYALQSDAVCEGIDERIEAGSILADVKSLTYDFYSGLNRIYFEFAGGDSLAKQPDAILVLLDGECEVVGVVDPFNPVQPNRMIAPLPDAQADLPFVLAQPSASESLFFTDDDLKPAEDRTRQFIAAISPSGLMSLPIGVAIGRFGGRAECFAGSNTTTSPGQCRGPAMVCVEVTGYLLPHCDTWDFQWRPDEVNDD